MRFILMVAVYWIFRRWSPSQVDSTFRRGQLVSAAAYSLGHGGNDAQKTMGIITAVLVAGNLGLVLWACLRFPLGCADRACRDCAGHAIGRWRIVHTIGSKITKPSGGGFCAETAGALRSFARPMAASRSTTLHHGSHRRVGSTRASQPSNGALPVASSGLVMTSPPPPLSSPSYFTYSLITASFLKHPLFLRSYLTMRHSLRAPVLIDRAPVSEQGRKFILPA